MACGGPMRQTPLLPQGSGNYWPGWRSFKASQGMFPVGEYFQVLSKTVRTAKNVGTQIPGWPHRIFPTLSLEGLRQIYQAKGPFSSDRGVAGKSGFCLMVVFPCLQKGESWAWLRVKFGTPIWNPERNCLSFPRSLPQLSFL